MDNAKMEVFGHLGRDPEGRYTPNGTMVTSTSIAVEIGTGDYKHTEWYDLTIWGEKFGELFSNMTQKGTFVWVSGTPKLDTWVDKKSESGKAQISINVKDFRVLNNGRSREDQDQTNPYAE